MLFPRTLRESRVIGFLPLGMSFTAFKCVFMAMSTPGAVEKRIRSTRMQEIRRPTQVAHQ